MLTEALVALAAGGGAAVVQAAGTDAWAVMRERVARLFGRSGESSVSAVLEGLDRTAEELHGTAQDERGQESRARLAAAWRSRFEELLEGLPPAERQEAELHLTELVNEVQQLPDRPHNLRQSGVSAEQNSGVAISGNAVSRAQDGSVSATVIYGGVHVTNPREPGATRP
ncbi:hypothetical protein ACFYZI_41590 [Streptomyces griseorubiginosus]|uniref:hypothetical protein n=1 Tax=Streptomyces griseorubiginosus TaxID=67304 RepID=UPI0036845505